MYKLYSAQDNMYFSTLILFIGLIINSCTAFGPPPSGGREAFRNAIAECRNKININEDEMQNVRRHVVPKTKNEQCMVACLEKKIGILGDDNKISMDKVNEKFSHMKQHREDMYNKMMKNIEECRALETTEADECVAGGKFAECMFPKESSLHPPHRVGKAYGTCKNKTGATDEEIRILYSPVIPKTKSAQCMLACVEKTSGVRGEDNKIIVEKLADSFRGMRRHNKEQYDKFLQIHKDCAAAETTEEDECEAALKFAQCVRPKLESTA